MGDPLQRICVFCGSSPGAKTAFADTARELGTELAGRGQGLVYGGAKVGLMGAVANAVLAGGGEAIGVIPTSLRTKEVAHDSLTRLEVVDSLHERKQRMADLADGFIALPGGMGTLDELFEVLTWAQLGIHSKPVGLINTDGFFDALLGYLDHTVSQRFVRPEHRQLLLVDRSPAALLDSMAKFEAAPIAKWMDRSET